LAAEPALPELASVYWRAPMDEARLRRRGRLWTLTSLAHVVPFLGIAALLMYLQPLAVALAAICVAHAWIIPALYAQRGANVVRPKSRRAHAAEGGGSAEHAERVSVGLLGDLIGHEARELHAKTGLVLERGSLGVWVVGTAGALLVRPGGRRVDCWCVRVDDPELPSGDRIAHLLLALRADEYGFATVANLAFSGACWGVRRRMAAAQRPALDMASKRAARTFGQKAKTREPAAGTMPA
jgi:hypothetical protein